MRPILAALLVLAALASQTEVASADEPIVAHFDSSGTLGYFVTGAALATDTNLDGRVDLLSQPAAATVLVGDIPGDALLVKAILYWAGTQSDAGGVCGSLADTVVSLTTPGNTPVTVTADRVLCSDGGSTGYDIAVGVADITALIGNLTGTYTVDGYSGQIANGSADNASFSVVLIYDSPSSPRTDLILSDGLVTLSNSTDVVTISDLYVDPSPQGSLAWYTLEGDLTGSGVESVVVEGSPLGVPLALTDAVNPIDNPMNRTINTSTPPQTDVIGVDIDRFDITPALAVADTSATVTYSAGTDKWWLVYSITEVAKTPADLQVTNLLPPSEVAAGCEAFPVLVEIGNVGGGVEQSFRLGLYSSVDGTTTTGDTFLSSVLIDGIATNGAVQETVWVSLPTSGPRGGIFLGAIVDDLDEVSEADEFNNSNSAALPFQTPHIASIQDVPNDQGRMVRLTLERSPRDIGASPTPILSYEVYRQIDLGLAAVMGRREPLAPQLTGWDYVTSIPAHGDDEYSTLVRTLADSTAEGGIEYSSFLVRAVTADPLTFFVSCPDSGFSVDNLAPEAPQNLLLAASTLSWDEAQEIDFDFFSIYGSASSEFGPGAVVIGHSVAPTFDVTGNLHSFYHVTATDFVGNESPAATAGTVVDVPRSSAQPRAFAAFPARPNPFRATTTVRFQLPTAQDVRLDIFDERGRRIRRLVSAGLPPGRHDMNWRGTDEAGRAVPSGIYLYRLVAGPFAATGKMIVLR